MATPVLRKILCVDDEPLVQAVARAALERVGRFTVLTCGSAKEALERAAEFGPDLILLDVNMPEIDGPAALAMLRRLPATAATPVAFLTTDAQARELGDIGALGACAVIAKPFEPKTLVAAVSTVWASFHAGPAADART